MFAVQKQKSSDPHAQNPHFFNSRTHSTQMINVFSSWWQDGHSLVARTNKPTHGSDVPALRSAPPPFLPVGGSRTHPHPPGHLTALLASSGLSCCWATMDVSQPAKVSDIWSSICDVTNSWLVIRPLWKGGSKGWMRRRPYFQQTLSWNAECFCIKLLRLQTEWLPLESDSIIYHNTIS